MKHSLEKAFFLLTLIAFVLFGTLHAEDDIWAHAELVRVSCIANILPTATGWRIVFPPHRKKDKKLQKFISYDVAGIKGEPNFTERLLGLEHADDWINGEIDHEKWRIGQWVQIFWINFDCSHPSAGNYVLVNCDNGSKAIATLPHRNFFWEGMRGLERPLKIKREWVLDEHELHLLQLEDLTWWIVEGSDMPGQRFNTHLSNEDDYIQLYTKRLVVRAYNLSKGQTMTAYPLAPDVVMIPNLRILELFNCHGDTRLQSSQWIKNTLKLVGYDFNFRKIARNKLLWEHPLTKRSIRAKSPFLCDVRTWCDKNTISVFELPLTYYEQTTNFLEELQPVPVWEKKGPSVWLLHNTTRNELCFCLAEQME